VHPGSYLGAAAVTTSTGAAATVSMQVTAQDPRWWLVLAFALAGGLAGIVVKLFADSQTARGTNQGAGIKQHIWTARTAVALAAGFTTAVYSFLTIYADDPTFAAEFGTLWRVAAETFGGTLAAKALTDLAGPPRVSASPSSSPSASPPAPAPPAS
jgi:cobalamin synthase